MLINTKFLTYITANVIMPFQLHIFTNFFSSKSNRIKTNIINLRFSKPMLFKVFNKFRMRSLKCQTSGIHELVLILNNLIFPCSIRFCVSGIISYS